MLPKDKMLTKLSIADKVNKSNMDNKKQELPDAVLHQRISFIKSAIRIAGYILIPFDIVVAVWVLVASEVIGIVEELV